MTAPRARARRWDRLIKPPTACLPLRTSEGMRRVVIRDTKSRKGSKWAQFGRLKRGVTEKRSARKLWALSVLSQIIAARRRGDRAEADRLYRGAWPEKARKRDLKAKGG